MCTCSLPMMPAIDDRLTIDPPPLATMAGKEPNDEALAPGVALLRAFALPFADDILGGARRHYPTSAISAHDHAMRRRYVSRDNQLRRGRVAERPRRLPLRS